MLYCMAERKFKEKVRALLSILKANPFGVRVSVIAEMAQMPRGEASSILTQLEAKNIVMRRTKPGGVYIYLKR